MVNAWRSSKLRGMRNDTRGLSFHLIDFLITNLEQDDWDIMEGVGDENGLEVISVTQRTLAELLSFQDVVLNPKRVQKLRDIQKGGLLESNSYREYLDVGGKALDDHSKISCLMRI